jgi:hypothetical protein
MSLDLNIINNSYKYKTLHHDRYQIGGKYDNTYDTNNIIKLQQKIKNMNKLNSLNLTNSEKVQTKYDLRFKFKLSDNDLILNKFSNLSEINLTNNHTGLFEFDYGMCFELLNSDFLFDVFKNYSNVRLNKTNNGYLLYWSEKTQEPKKINKIFLLNLINIFCIDIDIMNLINQIQQIPNIIKNIHMKKKIKKDLSYITNKNNQYFDIFYGQIKNYYLDTYEQNLYKELKYSSYGICFKSHDINIDIDINNNQEKLFTKTNISNTLKNLFQQNSYIDNIYFKLNNPIEKSINEINHPNIDQTNYTIKLKDLFKKQFLENNKHYTIMANNIFDHNMKIIFNEIEQNKNILVNSLIFFLNELIKKKIIYVIKLFNFIQFKDEIHPKTGKFMRK